MSFATEIQKTAAAALKKKAREDAKLKRENEKAWAARARADKKLLPAEIKAIKEKIKEAAKQGKQHLSFASYEYRNSDKVIVEALIKIGLKAETYYSRVQGGSEEGREFSGVNVTW